MDTLKRVFKFNNLTLEDPDPAATPDEVKDSYAEIYGELGTAIITGPEVTDDAIVYTFKTRLDTKGSGRSKGDKRKSSEDVDFSLMDGVARALVKEEDGEEDIILPPSAALEVI